MRSCKFYSAQAGYITNHEGLDVSSEYRFDKNLPMASCEHPELSAGNAMIMCAHERDHAKCSFFTEEEITPLRLVMIDHAQEQEGLELSRTRIQFGIVEFYITSRRGPKGESIEDNPKNVLHRVNAHEYGDGAEDFAREMFDHEVASRSQGSPIEMELPQLETRSYLCEATDEVRAAS